MKPNHAAGALQALRRALRHADSPEAAQAILEDIQAISRAARLAGIKPNTLLAELVKATPENLGRKVDKPGAAR